MVNIKQFYICVADWESISIIRTAGIWGVSDKALKQMSSVRMGDNILFYIKAGKVNDEKKDSSIFGIFEVSSNLWVKNDNIFVRDGVQNTNTYPNRIFIKKVSGCETPKEFRPLIQKLSFIKSKTRWGTTFMGRSMFKIGETDYKTIEEYLTSSK